MPVPQHSEKVLLTLWVLYDVLDKPFSGGRPPELGFCRRKSGPVLATVAMADFFEHGVYLLNLVF